MKLSNKSVLLFSILTIALTILRLLMPGFILLSYFWIIIPFYLLHFIGFYTTIRRDNLNKYDRYLTYISIFLLFTLTLLQFDDSDHGSYSILMILVSVFTNGKTKIDEQFYNSILPIIILSAIIDTAINVALIARFYIAKKTRL